MAALSSSTSCSLLRGPNRLFQTRQRHGSACETMQSEQLARPQGAWIRSKSESVCPHGLQAKWPRLGEERGDQRCRRRRRSSGEPNGVIEYDRVVDPAFSLLACIMSGTAGRGGAGHGETAQSHAAAASRRAGQVTMTRHAA